MCYKMGDKRLYYAQTESSRAMYKNLYRFHYKQRYRVLIMLCTAAAVFMLLAALYITVNGMGALLAFAVVWAAAVLLVYPRCMYRRPWKQDRDKKYIFRYSFFDKYYEEKCLSQKCVVKYTDIYKVFETGQYFYIYRDKNTVSVVDKSDIQGGSSEDVKEKLISGGAGYKRVR